MRGFSVLVHFYFVDLSAFNTGLKMELFRIISNV